jgi:hypothetical protein
MTLNARDDRLGGSQPLPPCPLVLELVIAGTDPLSGTVRPAGGEAAIAFHGWIDLMGAISSLGAGPAGVPGRGSLISGSSPMPGPRPGR